MPKGLRNVGTRGESSGGGGKKGEGRRAGGRKCRVRTGDRSLCGTTERKAAEGKSTEGVRRWRGGMKSHYNVGTYIDGPSRVGGLQRGMNAVK